MRKLRAQTISVSGLSDIQRENMYDLYASYYDETSKDIFFRDLDSKHYVILLVVNSNDIKGFTTLELLDKVFDNKKVKVIFSGDTILHHEFWGEQTLSLAWCEFTGKVKAEHPEIPLYWLLITKGHRTYRYLPVFFNEYFPKRNVEIPKEVHEFINYLSEDKFAESYQAENCTLVHSTPQGHLKAEWADAEQLSNNKEIKFFLSKNPDYAKGVELVCSSYDFARI